MTKKEMVGLGK